MARCFRHQGAPFPLVSIGRATSERTTQSMCPSPSEQPADSLQEEAECKERDGRDNAETENDAEGIWAFEIAGNQDGEDHDEDGIGVTIRRVFRLPTSLMWYLL